jgi:NhaP-type Na+/H+ and K+/H+ antiporter
VPDFLLVFGLVAIILVVTALASGAVERERSPLSFPLLFLGLGFLLGEGGLGLIEMGPHSVVWRS